MESQVLTPLDALESQLNALVTSLTQTNTFATAPQIAQSLLDADDHLTDSLSLLYRHQQNYARILDLRSEVTTLQDQLRSTIRQSVALRDEVGQIHPSILPAESDDEDEDAGANVAEVDYHTLLTFAARIGKHNAAAAREVEAESIRLQLAFRTAASANGGMLQESSTALQNGTEETNAEIEQINSNIALTRAQMGMSFPDAGTLRLGELGRLQLFRERQAQSTTADDGDSLESAMDREAERMVRETEELAATDLTREGLGKQGASVALSMETADQSITKEVPRHQTHARKASQSKASQESQPRRKLDLDFPSSDEEDD